MSPRFSCLLPLLLLTITPARSTLWAQSTYAWRSDSVTLRTATGTLAGTLELPRASGKVPLVVIIAGSGPTDRDGNSLQLRGANNSLLLLAEGLAELGIASVRYDKRGVKGSSKAATSETELRFEMYADDAAGWVNKFRDDARFSTVTILGHSEGSLLGMLAAQRSAADAYVSLAGISRPANQVLHDQLASSLPPELLREADQALDALVAGHSADSVPPALAILFRPSVQPYMMSWFRWNPSVEIARLTLPVLILQGTTDAQVKPAEADSLAKAQPRATLTTINGMNHVLKIVSADPAAQAKSYEDSSLPVARELVNQVSRFVQTVKRP